MIPIYLKKKLKTTDLITSYVSLAIIRFSYTLISSDIVNAIDDAFEHNPSFLMKKKEKKIIIFLKCLNCAQAGFECQGLGDCNRCGCSLTDNFPPTLIPHSLVERIKSGDHIIPKTKAWRDSKGTTTTRQNTKSFSCL